MREKKLSPKASGLCPLFCRKCQALYSALEKALSDKKGMVPVVENHSSLLQSLNTNRLLLGIGSVQSREVAVFLLPESPLFRRVQLYELPTYNTSNPIVTMNIKYWCQRTVEIVDWFSSIEDQGYGSILMEKLLSYLKLAGYSNVVGSICPVDYDHEDKLRHLYTKFGFTITVCETHRHIERTL